MNYISAEEFKKQSDKVQKSFIEWWQPKDENLITNEYNDIILVCNALMNTGYIDKPKIFKREIVLKNIDNNLKMFIPLLQMHQLIQFIEDKGYYIEFNNFQNKKWTVDIYISLMQTYSNYSITADDLLQALWQVAIKIAEQEVEGY